MNATLKKFLTSTHQFTDRAELSQVLEMSIDAVRRNEKNLGIADYKVTHNSRFIRYRRADAIRVFREKNIIPAATAQTA